VAWARFKEAIMRLVKETYIEEKERKRKTEKEAFGCD